MPTSEAQIKSARQNAMHSTGPKTPEGKEKSSQNALKPGQTGAGIVVPAEDAEEVERRFLAFQAELQPSGALGLTLVRRAATLAVRMENCAERDLAAISERVVQAIADVEVPDGVEAVERARFLAEAGRLAAFDLSKESCLARRYEAAAERGFFRALKEFRLVEKRAKVVDPARQAEQFRNELGSFLEMRKLDDEFDAEYADLGMPPLVNRFDSALLEALKPSNGRVDVPFTIGRGR